MPRYDYKCKTCGNFEEKTHSMKEQPIFICPLCLINGESIIMSKVIVCGLGVHFKGSGFYETDYKGK